MNVYSKNDLMDLQPRHAALIGLDSDGCVFPTMEIKQQQCFHGEIVKRWHLEKVERQLRECAEFINLRSKWRGTNRFPALLLTFGLLRERPAVRAAGVQLPDTAALKIYCESGLPLSNTTLQQEVARTGNDELARLLAWSRAVNANIARTAKNIPPFPGVLESLNKIRAHADLMVVSQTPEEALVREWKENGLEPFPVVIAGQELGTKAAQLQLAAGRKYAAGRVLMVGDALGDLRAAETAHALFYPINPGHEEASWQRFLDEAFDKFLAGAFAGDYQAARVQAFKALLPEIPPWKK